VIILNFYYNISSETSINNISKQKFFKGTNGKVVLLLHGYTGSPHDMSFLGHKLNKEGYSVFIPRLPGHGTNETDFLNSSWKDWLRTCVESYINLKNDYESVYIVGLSMGGLLTLLVASKFNPEKIVLAAPAIEVSNKMLKFTPFLKLFVKKLQRKNIVNYEDENVQKLNESYWQYDYIEKAADLYKLKKMAKKELPNINSKTLVILSKKDAAVPMKAKKTLERNINSEIEFKILEKSAHVVVNDVERKEVAEVIIEFLNN
jgi:carboxylesterase